MGNILAVMGLAALAGGMLFFGAVMAPLMFGKLTPDVAGPFIRAAFPRYYLYMIVTSVVAAIGLGLRGKPWYALVACLIAAVTVWLWLGWIPHLNALREAGNKIQFNRDHRLSVFVNAAQFIVAVLLLAGLAG